MAFQKEVDTPESKGYYKDELGGEGFLKNNKAVEQFGNNSPMKKKGKKSKKKSNSKMGY